MDFAISFASSSEIYLIIPFSSTEYVIMPGIRFVY